MVESIFEFSSIYKSEIGVSEIIYRDEFYIFHRFDSHLLEFSKKIFQLQINSILLKLATLTDVSHSLISFFSKSSSVRGEFSICCFVFGVGVGAEKKSIT